MIIALFPTRQIPRDNLGVEERVQLQFCLSCPSIFLFNTQESVLREVRIVRSVVRFRASREDLPGYRERYRDEKSRIEENVR